MVRIGLIGDRDDSVPAHRAIPRALLICAAQRNVRIEFDWLETETIRLDQLDQYDGLWCVPASPYRNTDLAISAIRFARENGVPFLGTCGGFQHAIIEFARNELGMHGAAHAETHPDAKTLLISPLACELVEVTDEVRLIVGSRLAAAYGSESISVGYHCRFGLNPDFAARLTTGHFKVAAYDASQAIRAMELVNHPFFVITLFQPERAALDGVLPPIVDSFIQSCVANSDEPTDPPMSAVRHDPNSPTPVRTVPNELEAVAMIAALANHGIEALATGVYTSDFRAEAPGSVRVVVRNQDLRKAEQVLAQLETHPEPIDWSKVDVGTADEET